MAVGSIVDYLKKTGKNSSYSEREKLAKEYGIEGYRGTAQQNTQLLRYLQEGRPVTGGTGNSGGGTSQEGQKESKTTASYLSGYNYQEWKGINQERMRASIRGRSMRSWIPY